MGIVNEKFEITSDVAAATVAGYTTISWVVTSAVSATPTIAASYMTSAESAVLHATIFAEVAALEVDVAAIRTKINA